MRPSRRSRLVERGADVDSEGRRLCEYCGDFIDPIDWCSRCMDGKPCRAHRRRRKPAKQLFCGNSCRQSYFNQHRLPGSPPHY